MARKPESFTYSYETLARLSGWPTNKVHQDVTRGDLDVGKVADAAVWLAANGSPELRARIARKIIPVVLGTKARRPKDIDAMAKFAGFDLMQLIFEFDSGKRKNRARRISRTRKK